VNLHQDIGQYIEKESKVLDLGCGIKTYSNYSQFTTTVDAWDKVEPDLLIDLEKEELPFKENSFDYVTMIDFIEHLDKDRGKVLLEKCKKIVRNKIILFTPLFWDDNSKNVNNPRCWAFNNKYDYHKSLWNVEEDFKDWHTINNYGPKNRLQWLGYWQK
jgi:cyclopropane fatty-acyl-phospholipid synthase-like methyltransferase